MSGNMLYSIARRVSGMVSASASTTVSTLLRSTPSVAGSGPATSVPQYAGVLGIRNLNGSSAVRGIEEFFPNGLATEDTESGRAWRSRDLRGKSNTDLHKLWYVLLKERNMLFTVRQEARRMQTSMPAPERVRKVRRGMAAIKQVLGERERAQLAAQKADPERWAQLRSEVEVVDTGMRRTPRKEKAGRVFRERPKMSETSQTEAMRKQLLGVDRPGLAVPDQPQRPMTKRERAVFRKELRAARRAVLQEKKRTLQEEISEMSDENLTVVVRAGEKELTEGWDEPDLSMRTLEALREAKRRGIETFFEEDGEPKGRMDKRKALKIKDRA
eukprot:m.8995 g.8995  ORF g.8995 m.8995 type:complete len:329 (+) comp6795_c0_seq1:90-1076(+)